MEEKSRPSDFSEAAQGQVFRSLSGVFPESLWKPISDSLRSPLHSVPPESLWTPLFCGFYTCLILSGVSLRSSSGVPPDAPSRASLRSRSGVLFQGSLSELLRRPKMWPWAASVKAEGTLDFPGEGGRERAGKQSGLTSRHCVPLDAPATTQSRGHRASRGNLE